MTRMVNSVRRAVLVVLVTVGIVGAPLALGPMTAAHAAGACGPPVVNPVACENTLTGTPPPDATLDRVRRKIFRHHDAQGSPDDHHRARLHLADLVYAGKVKKH